MIKRRNDVYQYILNKVRKVPMEPNDPEWMKQVLADLERHEGYREYAYPDPLSELERMYPARKYKWGTRPASVIMAELGIPVDKVHKGNPWTIGIGFTHGVKYTHRTTRAESYERLKKEVYEHNKGLDKLVPTWKTMPVHVQTVLINLIFNLGTTRLSKFAPTLALFSKGDYAGAARRLENTAWYRQVGGRAVELVERLRIGKVQDKYKV
jgi:GH24 family phage-related lysozyme (muramidase)